MNKKYPSLTSILNKNIIVDVVDVGAANIEEPPVFDTLLKQRKVNVIGFEPNLKALEMLNNSKSENEIYLPYVIGDGKPHTLNLCQMYGMTSILEPNYEILQTFNYFSDWAQIYNRLPVETKRIDDVEEIKNIDFFKLDIQGAELIVLENSVEKLKNCLVIQTEVEFLPMYVNQPLFSEIEMFLRKQGFILHNLLPFGRRMVKPLLDPNNMHAGINQLLWAEAIFIKDFNNLGNFSEDKLLRYCLILHDIYGSYDVVLKILYDFDQRSKTNYSMDYKNALVR